MLIRAISSKDAQVFDQVAIHPLQSFAWGEFRKKTGVEVERVGIFDDNGKIESGCQVTIHKVPRTSYKIGYFPKGVMPDKTQLDVLKEIGNKHNLILIKLEPNVGIEVDKNKPRAFEQVENFLIENGCERGKPLFTKYSFQIDLTKSEEELLTAMKSKTRYNVRLAQKHEVKVVEDNNLETYEKYLKLMEETTRRQSFYAHSLDYHRKMWQQMHKAGIARLLVAQGRGEILTGWVIFVFNGVMYYPYGASGSKHRELMASSLLMWEAMKWGKSRGLKKFDLWGALGPEPDSRDPWYGFHRFKQGFGGQLIEFVGTYDLVLKPREYKIYKIADFVRWKTLKTLAKIKTCCDQGFRIKSK